MIAQAHPRVSSLWRLERLVGAIFALAVAAALATAQPLNGRVDSLLADAKLGNAVVGVSIIDVESGRVLADRGSATPLIPASNMKLLTTGAACIVLGPDFTLRTHLVLAGDVLIVRGGGDPALADPALLAEMNPPMTIEGLMDVLAKAVASAGASSISQIVVDDRVFDRELVHPGWPTDQLHRRYCAPVSGLNIHKNVLGFFVSPASAAGALARVETQPAAPWVDVAVEARTTTDRNAHWVDVLREPAGDTFRVLGQIAVAPSVPVEVTVRQPSVLMGRLLARHLIKVGVSVGGVSGTGPEDLARAFRAVRLVERDEPLPAGRVVAVVTSHAADILARANRDSQNLYAESLLKLLGHTVTGEAGSWSNGASVLRMVMTEAIGPEHAASTVVADGSGLARENRVAPATMTAWLVALARKPGAGDAVIASLAGLGEGTLRRRFAETTLRNDLRAKSGTIDGVRCLSGYIVAPNGRRVAFAILINNLEPGRTAYALRLHEGIVAAADDWLARNARATADAGG